MNRSAEKKGEQIELQNSSCCLKVEEAEIENLSSPGGSFGGRIMSRRAVDCEETWTTRHTSAKWKLFSISSRTLLLMFDFNLFFVQLPTPPPPPSPFKSIQLFSILLMPFSCFFKLVGDCSVPRGMGKQFSFHFLVQSRSSFHNWRLLLPFLLKKWSQFSVLFPLLWPWMTMSVSHETEAYWIGIEVNRETEKKDSSPS